jgi:serine protease Do
LGVEIGIDSSWIKMPECPALWVGKFIGQSQTPNFLIERGLDMKRLLIFLLVLISVVMPALSYATAGSKCDLPIPELFKRASPSVVFISTVTIDPFRVTNRVGSSIGSGFIISEDGLVLTNSHVVFGSRAVSVTLDNGDTAPAQLLGADPILDIAVLRTPALPKGYPIAKLADSDAIEVGEEVVAIGNPLGLEQTITRGIVSGVNRILPTSPMSMTVPLIQTDTAINPGNSGGPLLNLCGEVIGINTATLMGVENIGFAIPINVAKQVVPQLVQHGRVIRPWLGTAGKLISKEFGAFFNIPLADGFLVETVEPGSPAEKAGVQGGVLPIRIAGEELLLGGDIVTAANGQPLNDPEKYMKFVQSLKVGDKVRLNLYRGGKIRVVEFHVVERPILPGDLTPCDQRVLSPMVYHGIFPRLKK